METSGELSLSLSHPPSSSSSSSSNSIVHHYHPLPPTPFPFPNFSSGTNFHSSPPPVPCSLSYHPFSTFLPFSLSPLASCLLRVIGLMAAIRKGRDESSISLFSFFLF
ncbi:uncharacterized protein K489DRAFT_81849 [Dissoconium aciculare CBS 342.82]|uniref:Uncharacterized protein n=1 Tax=Dissoconium aciculare CBS 342.82 TaxID=1314786 RepID=A0A6J3LUB4_9PEZI|nr:uncharacterized protein K489DRAFT_81849 [Dissoconium aciculare CBS 342.82]KAF1818864.1 hypothetical protein K489DRAFT_81849 [Dissoconium aciculare CBS 342.82]